MGGFLDRVGDAWDRAYEIGESAVSAVGQVPLAVVDLAKAPFTDDQYGGMVDTIIGVAAHRGARVLEETIGPRGAVGELIGGLPESAARRPVRAAISGIEWAGREVIREPIATVLLSAQLAESRDGGLQSFLTFLSPENLSDAHDMAQTTSVGQAFAIALGQVDLTDPKQVNDFIGSDFYKVASGATDAAFRLFLDVDVLAGKSITAARAGALAVDASVVSRAGQQAARYERLALEAETLGDAAKAATLRNLATSARVRETREVRGALRPEMTDIRQPGLDAYFGSQSWGRVNEVVDKIDGTIAQRTERIRDRFFHEDPDGHVFAYALARSEDAAEREQVMRLFMGDFGALNRIRERNVALGHELELWSRQNALVNSTLSSFDRGLFHESLATEREYAERLRTVSQEIRRDLRIGEAEESAWRSIIQEPRATALGGVRYRAKRSWVYQDSPFRAVRSFFEMRPRRMVDVSGGDPTSVIQVRRVAQEAGLGVDEVDDWTGRYSLATNDAERIRVLNDLERTALKRFADEEGLSPAQLEQLVSKATEGRAVAQDILSKRQYDAKGRARVIVDDEAGEYAELPLYVTQNANLIPMPDFRRLRAELTWWGDFKRTAREAGAGPVVDYPGEILTSVMKVWSPAVLIRPAWTTRVLLDEHLRMMAKLGASVEWMTTRYGIPNWAERTAKTMRWDEASRVLGRFGLRRGDTAGIATAVVGAAVGGPVGLVGGGFAGGLMAAMSRLERRGYPQLAFGGFKVQSAFGPPGDAENYWRLQVSAGRDLDDFVRKHESGLLSRFRRDHSRWTTAMPDRPDHLEVWARTLNDQMGQDPLVRQLLEGRSVDEVVTWARSPAGQQYLDRVPWRRKNLDEWIEHVAEQVDEYAMRGALGDELAQATLRREVTPEMLDRMVPETGARPAVHAAYLEQVLGRDGFTGAVHGFVDRAFELLGRVPTDELSRNNFFAQSYRVHMEAQLTNLDPRFVTKRELNRLELRSRRFALTQTKKYLYDLAERSEFAEIVRNFAPFLSASQEVLTRWVGIGWENPAVLARARQIFDAPNRAGLVYEDPDTGEEFVQLRLPEFARDLVNAMPAFRSAIDDQGSIRFAKTGFNLLGQGFPAGPIVNLALSEMARRQPDIEESMKFLFPFGVSEGWLDAFMPSTVRRALSATGDDNRERAFAQGRIILTRMTKMSLGELPPVNFSDPAQRNAFIESVEGETDAYMRLRLVTSLISPVAPIFDSPYQPYIEAYRALVEADPETATEVFIDQYGEEFFALTQSFSKSLEGIPPTFSGAEFDRDWRPFLDTLEDPALAGFVYGIEGEGGSSVDEFSSSYYRAQGKRELRPGTDTARREPLSAVEVATQPEVRLGWIEYSRAMDLVEAARIQRGLPNLRVARAKDLAATKAAVIDALRLKYPIWAEDFDRRDEGQWARRVRDLWRVAEQPRLQGRESVIRLRSYLDAREAVLAAMKARDIGRLDSVEAADIRQTWESIVGKLLEEPSFHALYYRWLERDPMLPETARSM